MAWCVWIRVDADIHRAAGISDIQDGTSFFLQGMGMDQYGGHIGHSPTAITLSLVLSSSNVLRPRG